MPSNLWLDTSHHEFYLVGYQIFLYSYKFSWALFWEVVKLPIKKFFPFMSCFDDFSGGPRAQFKAGHYWGKTFPSSLTSAPWVGNFSSQAGENRHCSWPCVSSKHFLSNSFQWIFPALSHFLTEWADQYWAEFSRVALCRFPEFSLCAPLSSLVLCPVKSKNHGLPGFLAASQTQKFAVFHLRSFSPYHGLEMLSKH